MIGKVIIDRDRNIIKNLGKWHMEPTNQLEDDQQPFY